MPAPEVADLLQEATLWPFSGSYDAFGQPTQLAPVSLIVRWIEERKEAVDAKGNNIVLDGTVIVGQHVDIHSLLWLGCSDDVYPKQPAPVHNWGSIYIVKTYKRTPDVKGRQVRRKLGVMRWKDVIPADLQMLSSVALTSSVNPSSVGQQITLTAVVTGFAPQGSVEFYSGKAVLGRVDTLVNSSASLATNQLPSGFHRLTAKFLGDQSNQPSTSAAIQQQVN